MPPLRCVWLGYILLLSSIHVFNNGKDLEEFEHSMPKCDPMKSKLFS